MKSCWQIAACQRLDCYISIFKTQERSFLPGNSCVDYVLLPRRLSRYSTIYYNTILSPDETKFDTEILLWIVWFCVALLDCWRQCFNPCQFILNFVIIIHNVFSPCIYLVCGNTMCVSTCQVEFVLRELLSLFYYRRVDLSDVRETSHFWKVLLSCLQT